MFSQDLAIQYFSNLDFSIPFLFPSPSLTQTHVAETKQIYLLLLFIRKSIDLVLVRLIISRQKLGANPTTTIQFSFDKNNPKKHERLEPFDAERPRVGTLMFFHRESVGWNMLSLRARSCVCVCDKPKKLILMKRFFGTRRKNGGVVVRKSGLFVKVEG